MSHNTWIHRMVRPAARPLKGAPVTLNQLTWLRLGEGVPAALGALVFGLYMAFRFRRGIARSRA